MSNVRRIKIGDKRYKLRPLNRDEKIVLEKKHLISNEWLFVSESDSYFRIVKKDSLHDSNLIIKTINKF